MHINTAESLQHMLVEVTEFVGNKPLDTRLEQDLNRVFGIRSKAYESIFSLCKQGRKEKLLCNREAGGIEFGRFLKPSEETRNFSVDVVHMDNIVGPHHVHPNGEIDLIMPLDDGARFDNHVAGWLVYGPGSAHAPTVTDGAALILYLLPDGSIEFK